MKWIVNWLRSSRGCFATQRPVLPRRVDVEIPGHLERLADPAGLTMARARGDALRESQLLVHGHAAACASRRVFTSRTASSKSYGQWSFWHSRCLPASSSGAAMPHWTHGKTAMSTTATVAVPRNLVATESWALTRPCRSATACALGLSRSVNPDDLETMRRVRGRCADRRSHRRRRSRSARFRDAPRPGSRRSL